MVMGDVGRINEVTGVIIGAAIDVHRELGPGLLESAYEACLAYELQRRQMRVERQKALPVNYRGEMIDCGYRVDLLVEDCVIVELKAVTQMANIHKVQLLTYLKLANLSVGLLINFNVEVLHNGVSRVVNNLSE